MVSPGQSGSTAAAGDWRSGDSMISFIHNTTHKHSPEAALPSGFSLTYCKVVDLNKQICVAVLSFHHLSSHSVALCL